MTPHEWLLNRVSSGYIPVVLGDKRSSEGGVPVFCMSMSEAPARHFFSPNESHRVHALIGLAVGAHQQWERLNSGRS